MHLPRLLVLLAGLVLALGAVACTGGSSGGGGEATATGLPSDPPAAPGVGDGPPPAWVEGPSDVSWLGFGSYCWVNACVDMLPPEERDDLPSLAAEAGDEVTFHLDFEPAGLRVSADGGEGAELPARSTVSWTVTGTGIVTLFAEVGTPGGDVSYHVRLTDPD